MSNVFLIRNDNYKYQELGLEVDDFIDLIPEDYDELTIHDFSYHNLELSPWWKNVEAEFVQIEHAPSSPVPDISCWIGATLALSPKAYDAVGDLLKPFGEFLPISCNDSTYYLFNCRTFGQVDERQSEQNIVDGEIMSVKRLQFDVVDVQDKVVFKTQYNRCLDMFCGPAFKQRVESKNLSGIVFDTELARQY
jgi:hypothetical protein